MKQMMRKNILIYFLGTSIFLLLSATNPSKGNFDQYISNHVRDYVIEAGENNDTADLASGLSYLILQSNNSIIKHDNYIIFSRFKIDASVMRAIGYDVEDIIVIGIFNQFIAIDGIK